MNSIEGQDGKEIELFVEDNQIKWRYVGTSDSFVITSLNSLKGMNGTNGTNAKEVEFSTSPTHIIWRYVGSQTWNELAALSSLKGPTGENGKSAYEIATDLGYSGSIEDWICSLNG